jgi:hypothetical protein
MNPFATKPRSNRWRKIMPANEYHFITEWRVEAPIETVYEILKDGKEYARWWSDVYLETKLEPSGNPDGIGDKIILLTRGKLPYKLRWTATAEHAEKPTKIEISASGDFVGRGIWELRQIGKEVLIRFDWRLRADKPLLRFLSPIFKPIFSWNHHWAMDKGQMRLREEIVRRT